MTRGLPHILPFVPMFAALAWAAVVDVRTRTIRNVLTVALAVAGLTQSLFPAGTVGPLTAVTGMAVGFGLGLVLFLAGGLGGGDVKLLSACGAWLGAGGVLNLMLAGAVIAMILVLVQATRDGQLFRLFQSAVSLVTHSMCARDVAGVREAVEASRSHASIGRPLPYAVPVLAAAVVVVFLQLGVRP
jgi:prepilin peptidase CpaA